MWCEDPSRGGHTQPAGIPTIDGTWGYGDDTPTNGNGDIAMARPPAPAELEARFADPTRFCR